MKIVIDTNVLISALLTPEGTCGAILRAVLTGQITLLLDVRIISEYESVTARKKFNFNQKQTKIICDHLYECAEKVLAKPLCLQLPDVHDLMFYEVGLSGQADYLVTGNSKHFPKKVCNDVSIISPVDFVNFLGAA